MSEKKYGFSYWLNVAVVLFLMFGFGHLPPIAGISELGMKGIGIFLGMIWGWALCGLAWPSLLGVIAVGMSGYMNVTEALQTMFSDSTTLQVMFVFALIAFLQKSGFAAYLARWFVSRKIAVGRPWIFSLLILTAAFVLSMFTIGVAAIAMTWAVYFEVCHTLGLTPQEKYTKSMLAGIVIAGAAGALCLPYQTMSLLYINAVESVCAETVNTLIYSVFRISTSYVFIILFLLFIRFIVRPDVSKLSKEDDYFAEMRSQKMNTEQQIGFVSLLAFLFVLVGANNFPDDWPLISEVKNWGLMGTVGLLLVILSIIQIKRKGTQQAVVDIGELMSEVDWVIVILLGCVAPISSLIESDEAGIFQLVVNSLTPIGVAVGNTWFVFVMSLLLGLLTQVSHNILLARVLMPLQVSIGISLNIDPMVMMMTVALPCQIAVCTPGASGFAGLLWGNKTWIDTKTCAILTFSAFIIMMIFNSIIIFPLAQIIY